MSRRRAGSPRSGRTCVRCPLPPCPITRRVLASCVGGARSASAGGPTRCRRGYSGTPSRRGSIRPRWRCSIAARSSHRLPAHHWELGAEAWRLRAVSLSRGAVSVPHVPPSIRRAVRDTWGAGRCRIRAAAASGGDHERRPGGRDRDGAAPRRTAVRLCRRADVGDAGDAESAGPAPAAAGLGALRRAVTGRWPMLTPTIPPATEQVTTLLTTFGLSIAAQEMVPRLTQAGHLAVVPVLVEVFDAEAEVRRQRRIARLRHAARLPPGKTFDTLDAGRLPVPIVQRLQELATGTFLETATNVLAFGLPGVGKSHALCAVGHALVQAGRSVLFTPAYALVQELLSAKRDLQLPRALRKLDLFEVMLLDDLGYVQQSPDEAEVLFTLLAERYERRSVMVTSNLVFS